MKKLFGLVFASVLCLSLCSCRGKSEAATAYEGLVAAIGEVTLSSEDAILAAETAYAALPKKEQKAVSETHQVLVDNRATYDGLVQAKLKAEAWAAHAAEVTSAIDAIGTVTLDSKDAIKTAKNLYTALTTDEQKLVTTYNVLEKAEADYNVLWAAEKKRIINEYSKKFETERDPFEGITWYTHKDMPDYFDERCYIIPYIGVKGDDTWICIRYNYTNSDNWIFWENLIILADGEKYSKTVGTSNTVRDSDTDVWEWWDECLPYNQTMDSSELQTLERIGDSAATIIRFQGDVYHYDFHVTKADKQMIRDTLAFYTALLG